MSKSWIIAIVIAIGATAWILSGQIEVGDANSAAPEEAADLDDTATEPESPPLEVRVLSVSAEPMVNELVLQGRTQADRIVDVRAETDGMVEEVLVEHGVEVDADTIIARLAVDDRQARLVEAEALLAQREIEFSAAESLNARGFRADTQLAEARASLDAASAVVELARIELDRVAIAAPFAGIVNHRHVEVGDYVLAGDPVATIVDLDPLIVVGQVAERNIGQITPGTVGSVRLVDGTVVNGVVSFVGNVANEVTRTFPVEIEVDNADGGMIQGLTAEMVVPIDQVDGYFLSPAFLTLSDDGEVGVKAVGPGDVVEFHRVRILGGGQDGVWLGDLPDSLRLIVVGQEFVQPGQRVVPVAVTAPEDLS